jgi:hypothetical protein
MTNQQIAENLLVAYRKVLEQSVYYDEDFIISILRELVVQLQYYQCCRDQDIEDMVLDARAILDVADELEAL